MKKVVQATVYKGLKIYVPESEIEEVKGKLEKLDKATPNESTKTNSSSLTDLKL